MRKQCTFNTKQMQTTSQTTQLHLTLQLSFPVTSRACILHNHLSFLHPSIANKFLSLHLFSTLLKYQHSVLCCFHIFALDHSCRKRKMASEVVTVVDDIQLPKSLTLSPSSKPLNIVGYGITDMEIHFLQIKFTAIGVYVDAEVASHLQAWKGKTAAELLADDSFFDTLLQAPVEKFIRVVVIKEIKGSQYGLQLEGAVRDRLVAIDKYEDEEEEALTKVVEFFQGKYLKKNSVITYHFPANSKTVEVTLIADENKETKTTVENVDVSSMIKKWYLGGSSAVSSSTITSFTEGIAPLLK